MISTYYFVVCFHNVYQRSSFCPSFDAHDESPECVETHGWCHSGYQHKPYSDSTPVLPPFCQRKSHICNNTTGTELEDHQMFVFIDNK